MIALIKTTDTTDIICEPFPQWLDPVAFAIFDCYGYAICSDYQVPAEGETQNFTFGRRKVKNPYKQSEEDTDETFIRTAVLI